MNRQAINKWWQSGIDKERQRFSNAPKSPKSKPFLVPEINDQFVPLPGRAVKS